MGFLPLWYLYYSTLLRFVNRFFENFFNNLVKFFKKPRGIFVSGAKLLRPPTDRANAAFLRPPATYTNAASVCKPATRANAAAVRALPSRRSSPLPFGRPPCERPQPARKKAARKREKPPAHRKSCPQTRKAAAAQFLRRGGRAAWANAQTDARASLFTFWKRLPGRCGTPSRSRQRRSACPRTSRAGS